MKKIIYMAFLVTIGIILIACSEKEEERLTRVDVQAVDDEGNYGDVYKITDQDKVDLLSRILENVSWERKQKLTWLEERIY